MKLTSSTKQILLCSLKSSHPQLEFSFFFFFFSHLVAAAKVRLVNKAVEHRKKKVFCSRHNNLPPANFAARNSCSQIARLERLWVWWSEHIMAFNCRQPVAEGCSVVVASAMTMAFNKWIRSELFKTGTW